MGWAYFKAAGQQNPKTISGRKSRGRWSDKEPRKSVKTKCGRMPPYCWIPTNWLSEVRRGSYWRKKTEGNDQQTDPATIGRRGGGMQYCQTAVTNMVIRRKFQVMYEHFVAGLHKIRSSYVLHKNNDRYVELEVSVVCKQVTSTFVNSL